MSVENIFRKGEESEQSRGSSSAEVLSEMPDFSVHMEQVRAGKMLKEGYLTVSVYIRGGDNMDESELRRVKREPEAYNEERQLWHNEILDQEVENAHELSKKLGPPPKIIAMRGGCGAGKTTAVKEKYGDKGIVVDGDVPGAVKPDYFKDKIQEKAMEEFGVEITSSQAHLESTGVCKMFLEQVVEEPEVSLLIDKQLEAPGDIPEIIKLGKESGKQVVILDLDVPIELAAFRVLKRPLDGKDPSVEFFGITRGFVGIRANRWQVLEDVKDEIVSDYSLKAFDPVSKRQIEIIKKVDGEIVYEPGFEELGKAIIEQDEASARAEAAAAENQIITPEYVEEFVSRFFDESENAPEWSKRDAKEAREILGSYALLGGITLGEALDSKAAGLEPQDGEKLIAWVQQQRMKHAGPEVA